MSFEHERQIVMLSGTLLTQKAIDRFVLGVRHQLAQRFARAGG